ncbi:SRPBCC domain-containing protein [Candidatus Gottesmanbacteria bacterium]|nr:SRPBCC domain-containing protein [Candidatus Gottesmanbacteria bacterium]
MDEREHAAFTNASANIENKVGGRFSVWDGYASGKNKKLVPGKKIVQQWRASDWPEGVFSTVTFTLKADKNSTILEFTQVGVPKEFEKDIIIGWNDYYWTPLNTYLSQPKTDSQRRA